ncbi:hypothetical protein [Acetatifactor muris]|uniref:hypothetical protein n=1 Tax=Acetatifactor muris TaxID=879566 RepID=UPI0023F3B4E0|nr:hypothetical protein [Acetatifactor muris]MCI8800521.1 hypothetical protein [Lachnospiraceae bacterium]
MNSRDYEKILNAMPETGVYVIQEEDHSILYFNKRVQQVCPDIQRSRVCHEVWGGSCKNCPLLTIKSRQESRSISYNALFGGVVDIIATRTLWEDTIPAFVITVTPRIGSYTYRKLLRVDLEKDTYDVLKVDSDIWLTGKEGAHISAQLENLVKNGAIHSEDVVRFTEFIEPNALRNALLTGKKLLTCIYRRRCADGFRWHMMEIIPAFDYTSENQTAIFCVRDVHDMPWSGVESSRSNILNGIDSDIIRRELISDNHSFQMAPILKARYSMMSMVHLDSGQCERLDLTHVPQIQNTLVGDYDHYVALALADYIHPEDTDHYRRTLSLQHLREKATATKEYAEERCQYRMKGTPVRWIEQHVVYIRQGEAVTVNLLGQDITEKKQQEALRLQAMQDRAYIIGSLSSLFFSTYYIDLEHDTFRVVSQLSKIGDILGDEVNCTAALQVYANNFIHSEDREKYLQVMNIQNWLKHLRWWNPYVTVEYRTIPDNPGAGPEEYMRVRATAVLAQTGAGDLPKTVVYVAQNMTESQTQSAGKDAG